MKRTKIYVAVLTAAVLTFGSAFAVFAAEPAADGAMNTYTIEDLTASDFVTNNSAGVNRGDHDLGRIYVGVAITDGAVDEANSNWADRVTEEDGAFNVEMNDDVTGEGFTAVRAFGEGTINVTGNLNMYDEGDGTYDSDFTGMGAAVCVSDGADMYVKDVNFYSDGIVRSFGNVSAANLFVENSSLTAMGGNPFEDFYGDYINGADMEWMIAPPWVLGIQGAVRTINLLGQASNLVVADSDLTSGGWAVCSTDTGSNPTYWIYNTSMTILPASQGGMTSGWKILGYDEDAYGSGYAAFLIGSANEHFYGVDINGPTYAAIMFGGNVTYEGLKAGQTYEALASGTDEVIYTYTAEEDKPATINTVFGFLAQVNGTVSVLDGTVMNTAEAIALYKEANVDWLFSGAELHSDSGILIQMMDSDNSTIASVPGGFASYLYEEAGFPRTASNPTISYVRTTDTEVDPDKTYYEESGVNEYSKVENPTDAGTVAYFEQTASGSYGTATFENGDYEGDIYNATGYFGQAGDALDVTIAADASLTGDIVLATHVHGIWLNGRNVDDVIAAIDEANAYHATFPEGHYYANLDDIGYVFIDAEGNITENKDEAVALQFTQFSTVEYYLVGHVINMPFYNGASHINVTVEGTWKPVNESLVTYLKVAEGAHVFAEVTDMGDGSFLITPSDTELAPGSYGDKLVKNGDDGDSSSGESGGGEAAGDSAEGESPEGESAEGESAEGESAEGESAEGEVPADGESAEAPADGESADSEAAPAEGAEAPAEGESAEGESAEGESAEGEAPADAAAPAEGDSAEGESAEGESAEGEAPAAGAEGESADSEAAPADGAEAPAESEGDSADGESPADAQG